MNSSFAAVGVAVLFAAGAVAAPRPSAAAAAAPPSASAVLAGGCFWGMEEVFEKLKGVTDVQAGYSGGQKASAHYEQVSTGTTGHAESIRIAFDPRVVSYRTLLDVYFTVAHDPTELDRQGPDSGTQYRSAIFYANQEQQRTARAEIAQLVKHKAFGAPIVTELVPLHGFYPAETYHQHYADRNPDDLYILTVDAPKVVALRADFPKLLKRN